MAKTIAALYDNVSDVYKAVRELKDSSAFTSDDINIVSQDVEKRYSKYIDNDSVDLDDDVTTPTEAGAGAGATAGTVIGALVGLMVGTSTIILPGVGAILALGPIGATLAGAGAGAAIGGLTGALVGYGIEESDAHVYSEAVRRGSSLLLVRATEANVSKATNILEKYDPIDIEKRADHWRSKGWDGFDTKSEPYTYDKMRNEYETYPSELRSRREGYGVSSYDYYTDSDATLDPTLRSDFDSHYTSNPPSASSSLNRSHYNSAYHLGADMGSNNKYSKMKWEEAQADAHKRWAEQHDARDEHWEEVKDRVQYAWHKAKSKYHETTSNTGTTNSMTNSTSTGTRNGTLDPTLRSDFESHYASHPPRTSSSLGRTEYNSAYRLGAAMADNDKYRKMKWEEAQAEAHKRWAEQHDARDEHWEEVKDRVQYAWHKAKSKYHETTAS